MLHDRSDDRSSSEASSMPPVSLLELMAILLIFYCQLSFKWRRGFERKYLAAVRVVGLLERDREIVGL
jgi:hypothetical protein